MAEEIPKYKSTLTGPELDEALRNIGKVQDAVQRTEVAAQTAEQYGQIVEQNQAAIQAIEDNLADVQGAAQNAADAKNAASSAAASASAASQSASDAEDAAKRAEAAAGVNPDDFYTKSEANATFVASSGLLDLVYPVGSIYMSTNNTSPKTFLGGTWQQIQGQFLLAASSSYPAGSTGGEASHTLTRAELPNEKINVEVVLGGSSGSSYYSVQSTGPVSSPPNSADAAFTKPLGSGLAHNNMPPYLSVYVWKRTA